MGQGFVFRDATAGQYIIMSRKYAFAHNRLSGMRLHLTAQICAPMAHFTIFHQVSVKIYVQTALSSMPPSTIAQ